MLVQVDTEMSPRTKRRFEKAGYLKTMPTLLLFRDRQVFQYKGPWNVQVMADFAFSNYTKVGPTVDARTSMPAAHPM